MIDPSAMALAAITLLAAVVNGALGYGFSSITRLSQLEVHFSDNP
jgi:hypothetical protein